MTTLPIWAHWLVAAGLGLIMGSFLNVVIVRLPPRLAHAWQAQSVSDPELLPPPPPGIVWERSHCPHCKTPIAWHDNVPVVSWLWLKGRCRQCQRPIGLRYPIIELLSALLSVVIVWQFGLTGQGLAGMALTWLLLGAAAIDLEHHLLPDVFTFTILWMGLLVNALFGWFATPTDAIVGAVAGYGFLWLIFHGFLWMTGKEGLGFGDLKLLAGLGAWLGWSMLPFILFAASVAGTLAGLGLMVIKKRGRDVPIAFGPYLAIAGWVAFVWQSTLMDWFYLY